jgi:two-component system sensor histidine kinase UhpB
MRHLRTANRTLLAQVLGINALLVAVTVVAASAGARLGFNETLPRTSLVLLLAICVTLLANAFLLRRRFRPLEQLTATMESVDLALPGVRAATASHDPAEVKRLNAAFNRMLDRLETERRQGALAVVRGQEAERQRLAQDLHDEVNQALTAVLLRLEATIQTAPPELRRELAETKGLAVQAMDELLRMARELRPKALDDHGLVPALHAQVQDFARRTGVHAEFHRTGPLPPLSDDQQLAIYRVVQESLSNVAQHAGATKVDVELSFVGRPLLRVRDDGEGFTNGHRRPGGLGLSGMRERAVHVGARLDIRSRAGRGTTVELRLG